MKRGIVAALLLLHGLAHASAGMWASSEGPMYLVTPLWAAAMLGYIAAALGLWRVPVLRVHWKELTLGATIASLVMLMLYTELVGLIGAAIGVALLLVAFTWAQPEADAAVDVAEAVGAEGLEHPTAHRVLWAVGAVFLAYAAAVVVMRPMYAVPGAAAVSIEPGDSAPDLGTVARSPFTVFVTEPVKFVQQQHAARRSTMSQAPGRGAA
ncbi:MAG TPA: hypothetical protein VHB25_01330 [Gemmatimonadaceae bacterium]|nr:hypothetical protein [Gemmatimonadaceae bacterium]